MHFQNAEHMIEIGGVRQWVRVAGTAASTVPLVLVHGGPGGNHFVFERTAGPLLARERTVVYHEQRGSGRSEAPADPEAYDVNTLVADLDELREQLGVPVVDLLGYSFGAGLALAYTHRYPQHVRRVVAQAPVLDLNDDRITDSQLAGFARTASPAVRDEVARITSTSIPAHERLAQVWQNVDRETVDAFLFHTVENAERNRRWWQESGLVNTGLMHQVVKRAPILAWDELRQIDREVLVVVGRHDRNVPVAYAESVARTLPRGSLRVLTDSAHFPDIEETESYTRVVSEFLDSTTPGTSSS